MNVSYQTPGFGIVLILDNTSNLAMTEDAYLFKIGSSDFSIFRKHKNKQTLIDKSSSIIEPSLDNKNQHIVFDIVRNKVTMTAYIRNNAGNEEKFTLGERKISGDLSNYFIGFYSNKGNTIKRISFEQPLPTGWKTNINNTDGGYLGFLENGFYFENCLHDAEVEQDNIILQPGKYYLSFNTEKINDIYDLDTYVIKQEYPDISNEENFEDESKNIINPEDNSFIIDEESRVILKFRGMNGKVSDISIHTNSYGGYVPTEDTPVKSSGSIIDIDLTDVTKVEWQAIIKRVPEYIDLTKKAPYGVVSTQDKNYTLENLEVRTEKEYLFEYNVETSALIIKDVANNVIVSKNIIKIDEDNTLHIMFNVSAVIYKLKLYFADGKEDDVILQKDIIRYVPLQIYSPIVVRHKDSGESLDISASYREEVSENKKFILMTVKFSNGEIEIPGNLPDNSINVKAYGIPVGANLDTSANNINDYTDKYEAIEQSQYEISKGVITFDELTLNRYEYILIEYNDISEYDYKFTNYEREYFDIPVSRKIRLTKTLSNKNPLITIYGVKTGSFFNPEYIYRIPKKAVNSLDYYCNDYDVLSNDLYEVDLSSNIIKFEKSITGLYDHLIIDYMKKDSYSINLCEEIAQYEVNISSDDNDLEILYDIHDDGTSAEYITVTIPDSKKNNFIVLRKIDEDDCDEN